MGKHPTQKPVALLERILLAATNEGDLVLDPFLGGGTTAVSAFRARRRILGCDAASTSIDLSCRRICSELVQVRMTLTSLQFPLDLFPEYMDRSDSTTFSIPKMSAHAKLVQRESTFYFIGKSRREVIFTVVTTSLHEAYQKFHAAGCVDADVIFIVKTETEIYLA